MRNLILCQQQHAAMSYGLSKPGLRYEEEISTLFFVNKSEYVTDHGKITPPWSRVLLEKLTGSAASQEIPRIFGTRRFITVPTSARHLSLS